MTPPPTEIFLHNPQGLRIAFTVDTGRLQLWWSPLAGRSTAARDRNFSNRDEHLEVFAEITLETGSRANFEKCSYDPYHSILHYRDQTLHLVVRPDRPALMIWAEQSLRVNLASGRYDAVVEACHRTGCLRHTEPAYTFVFTATMGVGTGAMRHSPFRAEWSRHYTEASLAPGQLLVLAVGLDGDATENDALPLANTSPADHLRILDEALSPHESMGRTSGGLGEDAHAFRASLVRGLHSMIDESGAFRASLKAIYYLIWVRDAGFAFAYQAAAGWPHKLGDLCRLLLDNPTVARGEGVPSGRMFAQLINPDYGKYEEDGIYYVLWTVFNHWTQTGRHPFAEGTDLALLEEALAWVEARAFDESAGLFGGYFADETPAYGSRDYGWDYAIGKPAGDEHIRHEGHRVTRSYDIYLNTLLHSTYTMLAALCRESAKADAYTAKAAHLWERLQDLYRDLQNGLPPYGDLLCEDGQTRRARPWGPASSTYIWALAMPNFLPLENRDALHRALLDAILAKPEMHWINGICAAVAAADPWVHGEARLLAVLERIRVEAMTPGPYLPMGGAMPEKLGAPPGSLHHDIRPQGFAMAAWLGAWAALGVRRLAHGLALRPTRAFARLEQYSWREGLLDFDFEGRSHNLEIHIDGQRVPHTLQLPEDLLGKRDHSIRLVDATEENQPLLLHSTVRLLEASNEANGPIVYRFIGYGLSEITIVRPTSRLELRGESESPILSTTSPHPDGVTLRFTHRGPGRLIVG